MIGRKKKRKCPQQNLQCLVLNQIQDMPSWHGNKLSTGTTLPGQSLNCLYQPTNQPTNQLYGAESCTFTKLFKIYTHKELSTHKPEIKLCSLTHLTN